MSLEQIPIYLVVILTYIGLGIGNFPGLRMNRATIALVGASFLITLGGITLEEAWKAIDANTIVFLLSMMILNANLAYSGFFQLALTFLVRLTRSPFGLLCILTFGCGFLSAFILNDTIVLIFTPLIVQLTKTLNLNPIPYLLALAASTNLGSMATLSGNPQNILIGSFAPINYLEFASQLTPIALLSLGIQIGLLCLLYPEVCSLKPSPYLPQFRYRIYKPLFKKTVIITLGLFTAFALGLPLGKSALTAASLLLITRRIKPQKVFQQIEWNLLIMFSGLFVLTYATQKLNILALLTPLANTPIKLLSVTVILSNLISNVPAVLVLQPLIEKTDISAWLLLSAGSTLAGNLTLFGSVANLIMAEAAASLGYQLGFKDHLRFGLPLTLITLVIAYWGIISFN